MSDSNDRVGSKYLDRLNKVISEGVGNQTRIRFLTICTDAQYIDFPDSHLELIERFQAVGQEFEHQEDDFVAILDATIAHLKAQHRRLEVRSRRTRSTIYRLFGHAWG